MGVATLTYLLSFTVEKGSVSLEGRICVIIQLFLVGVHNTGLVIFLVSLKLDLKNLVYTVCNSLEGPHVYICFLYLQPNEKKKVG